MTENNNVQTMVFPARAGMSPGQCHAVRALQRVPCVGGDEPTDTTLT